MNCLFRLENPEREETEVSISWEDAEGTAGTEQRQSLCPATGDYRCVIRDANEQELGHASFELVE